MPRNGVPAAVRKREDDYQCEEDHRTLMRGEEIRADKKRMSGVRRHQRKQMRVMSRMNRSISR